MIEPLESLPELFPLPNDRLQIEDWITEPESLEPEPLESELDPEENFSTDLLEERPNTFSIQEIQVLGNSRFHDEIEQLVLNLEEKKDISLADLLDLRTDITRLYIEGDYLSSGAFIPTNQELNDGIVQIQVVEGEIEQLQIRGLERLREGYVRDRIARVTKPPLNINYLEEGLQLLQIDPVFQSVDAELTAGSGPGKNILILELAEADPFYGRLSVDNYRSPSIGSLQGTATVDHINLLGVGDRLNLGYSLTEGLDNYQVGYTLPLNASDGTFQISYQTSDSDIIEAQFLDAGIRSSSETLSFKFRQPVVRSISNEVTLGLDFDLRESRSFIADDLPFSFSVGPEAGVSKVRALRFSQEWVNRDINTVLAMRSQINLGLGIFDATVNDTGTDGRFISWQGQFQWVEQFSPGTLLLTRVNAQLTADSLLPLERFSVGGVNTVRGYTQNQIVADNAVTLSTEFRFPVADNLQLTPFIDAGGGWNNQTPDPEPSFLLGTGLGFRWQPSDNFNLRVDYGIPLISPGEEGKSFQDNGLYFSVNMLHF